jgi:hypothetical protein
VELKTMFSEITCTETGLTSLEIKPAYAGYKITPNEFTPLTAPNYRQTTNETIVDYFFLDELFVEVYNRRSTVSEFYKLPLPRSIA